MIQVPEAFAAATVAREGAAGAAWIRALPGLVDELCGRWGLEAAGPVRHGYVGVVVPVLRERTRLALKVSWIDRSSEHEALALRAWNGHGAVLLVDAMEEKGALLLEWLDPDRTLATAAPDPAAAIAGTLLRRLAVPAPPELRTVRAEIDETADALESRWADLGRPFPRALLDHALEVAHSHPDGGERLIVNQDLHFENVLAGEREPWLAIDPKPLLGDPEFGVAPLLWNRFDELEDRAALERRLAIVVEAAGLDREKTRRLAVWRLVDAWVWALGEGIRDDLPRCRALIEWLVPRLGG